MKKNNNNLDIEENTLSNLTVSIKGIKYLKTGIKRTKKGWSYTLKNLETNEQILMNDVLFWIDDKKLNEVKD